MKVFFGGSALGFRANKSDYLEIRRFILDLGHGLTRDWIDEELKGEIKRSHNEMYELTEKAIKSADSVILDYSYNISAVGQQLLLALEKGIPTLLLAKDSKNTKDSPLSDWFISSRHHKYLKKQKYTKKNQSKIITDFLAWVKDNKSIIRFNLEVEKELDDYLKEKAKHNKSSKSEEIRKLILADIKASTNRQPRGA